MSNLPFPLPDCRQPGTTRVEVYTPAGRDPYGSLDASVYACHHHVTDSVAAVWAAGLSAYAIPMAPGISRVCGDRHVYPTGLLAGWR